jgi:hypothetical protein
MQRAMPSGMAFEVITGNPHLPHIRPRNTFGQEVDQLFESGEM